MSRCKRWIAIAALLTIATALVATVTPQRADATTLKSRLHTARHHLRHSRERLKDARAALAAALLAQTALTGTGIPDPATPSPVPTPTPTASGSPTPEATPTPEVSPTPEATPTTDATSTPEATPTPDASPSPEATPTPATTATAVAAPTIEQLRARVVKARRAVRAWHRRVHRLEKRYRFRRAMARWERTGDWMPIIRVAAAKYHVSATGVYRMMMRESGGHRNAGSSTAFKGLFQYHTGTWAASWNPWRHDSIYDGSSQIFATCYAVSRGMGASMWTTTYWSQY